MKSLPAFALAVASAALVYAAAALIRSGARAPVAGFEPPSPSAKLAATGPRFEVPADWPALFGADSPAPMPPRAEAPPAPSGPLIRSDLRLTGLVTGFGAPWAFVASDQGPHLVRPGDWLDGGERVTGIDASGVWLEQAGSVQLIPVEPRDLSALARPTPSHDPPNKTAPAQSPTALGHGLARQRSPSP